jgi:hypothetical protein
MQPTLAGSACWPQSLARSSQHTSPAVLSEPCSSAGLLYSPCFASPNVCVLSVLLDVQIAKRQAVVNPENTFFSVKRFVGRRMSEVTEECKQVPYVVSAVCLSACFVSSTGLGACMHMHACACVPDGAAAESMASGIELHTAARYATSQWHAADLGGLRSSDSLERSGCFLLGQLAGGALPLSCALELRLHTSHLCLASCCAQLAL